ncbi:MAG: hypothetical protein PHI68_07170 [Candidatus Cloacimonetes bacterium]|nr:hypothetical protein [Candidatus Cloacimonadota bacterium]
MMTTQAFFFKINLNKFGEMKLQAERENRTLINSIVAFVVVLLVLIGGMYYVNMTLGKKLDNRIAYYNDLNKQLSQYQTSEDYLSSADLERLATTFDNRIFWAKKMVALAEVISDRLAVSKLNFNQGVLTLNGITEIQPNINEMNMIGEFINRIKSNEELVNDFPDVKMGSVTKRLVKDTEIMDFVIECYSKEKGGKK